MDRPAPDLFNILLEILASVVALPRSRWTRDLDNLSLIGGIGDVLELAVAGYIELSNSLMRPFWS